MVKRRRSIFGALDMTEGSPFMCLLLFSIPLLIGNVAQLMYTTIDAAVVGQYIGPTALAAVGTSNPVYNFFIVWLMGIGSGVTIMVSQYFGAKDHENLNASIGNSITLIAILSVVITAVSVPLAGALINLICPTDHITNVEGMRAAVEAAKAAGLPETAEIAEMAKQVALVDMAAMAKTFLVILFIGSAGNGFYNVLSGILRGLGESVFPLLVLVFSVAINAGLVILFIGGFGMGIEGAAWATVIAQVLSAVACLVRIMLMRDIVKIKLPHLRLRRRMVGQIIHLGLPNAIAMGIMFGSAVFLQNLIVKMGVDVAAAVPLMMRLDGFAMLPGQTFSIAASTFTGQNIGAGRMDRVKQGSRMVSTMCLVFTAVMVAGMLLFGRNLLGLFTSEVKIIDMCMTFILIMCPAYFAMVVSSCSSGVMRGAGDTIGPMWISLIMNVIIRVPLSYILAYFTRNAEYINGHPNTLFISMLISMLIGSGITIIYYRAGKWRNKAVTGNGAPALEI